MKNKVLIVGCLVAGILFALEVRAQSGSPLARLGDVWTVSYRVSVIGEFSTEPDEGKDGPTTNYHIDRIYAGKAKLTFAPNPAHPDLDNVKPLFKDPGAEVNVQIDDLIHVVFSPICGEYETVEESAKGRGANGDPKLPVPALLLVDNKQLIYKTSFPVVYIESPNSISKVDYRRQEFDNPGHEPNGKAIEKRLPFALFQCPDVAGYIKSGSIQHTVEWSKLRQESSSWWSWTSDILKPDKPLIEGVSDSREKVGIVITYDIKRLNR